MKNNTKDLLGKYVKFWVGRKLWYGRVSSIEQDMVNIIGAEQKKRSKSAYHYPISEITECSHAEVFKIGRSLINLFR